MSGGLDVFAVRDARPELFRTAVTEWRRFADRLRARVSELATGVQAPLAGGQAWTGHAQEAAAARLDTYLRQLRLAEQESRTVAAVLAGAADAFDLAHDQVVSLLAEAARAGCRVQADGGVTPAPLTVAERHADDPASSAGLTVNWSPDMSGASPTETTSRARPVDHRRLALRSP